MELLLLGIFSTVLLACIFTGISVIYAMILGLVVFLGYGLIKKKTWKPMLIFSWQGMYKEISFVCLRPDGCLELPSTLSIACRTVAKRLDGFENFHFHQLRHTYTSNLLSNGAAPIHKHVQTKKKFQCQIQIRPCNRTT